MKCDSKKSQILTIKNTLFTKSTNLVTTRILDFQASQNLQQFTAATTASNHLKKFVLTSFKSELVPRWLKIDKLNTSSKQLRVYLTVKLTSKA